jgi:hypothetical protein
VASSPYPSILDWRLPHAAIGATLAGVADAGRRGDEGGVFWLGDRAATSSIRAVVLLRGHGVVERPGRWAVGHEAFGVVARLARSLELTLLGTAHIHGRGAPVKMSWIDRRHGVRVPDFLAVVIGEAGAEADPMRWSWNVFGGGDFHEFDDDERHSRIALIDGTIACWKADAAGASRWDGGDE